MSFLTSVKTDEATTEAPTGAHTTEEPTKSHPTEAPTEGHKTEAPTQPEVPTEGHTTGTPTHSEVPTEGHTTETPTQSHTTEVPTESAPTESPAPTVPTTSAPIISDCYSKSLESCSASSQRCSIFVGDRVILADSTLPPDDGNQTTNVYIGCGEINSECEKRPAKTLQCLRRANVPNAEIFKGEFSICGNKEVPSGFFLVDCPTHGEVPTIAPNKVIEKKEYFNSECGDVTAHVIRDSLVEKRIYVVFELFLNQEKNLTNNRIAGAELFLVKSPVTTRTRSWNFDSITGTPAKFSINGFNLLPGQRRYFGFEGTEGEDLTLDYTLTCTEMSDIPKSNITPNEVLISATFYSDLKLLTNEWLSKVILTSLNLSLTTDIKLTVSEMAKRETDLLNVAFRLTGDDAVENAQKFVNLVYTRDPILIDQGANFDAAQLAASYPSPPQPNEEDSGLKGWQIALIVVASILGAIFVVLLIYLVLKKKSAQKGDEQMLY